LSNFSLAMAFASLDRLPARAAAQRSELDASASASSRDARAAPTPRIISALTLFCAALSIAAPSAYASDMTIDKSARFKIGETRRLVVVGAHKSDCKTSIYGEVDIVRAPKLGTVSQSANAPYVVATSISGTCLGANLYGTGISYTANSPGKDFFQFDAVFPNGRAHYNFTIENH
jgi:hypothetical protein